MKMLDKHTRDCKTIIVIDLDGNETTFEGVKAAAKALDCEAGTVYNAISKGKKVRGCAIKRKP